MTLIYVHTYANMYMASVHVCISVYDIQGMCKHVAI